MKLALACVLTLFVAVGSAGCGGGGGGGGGGISVQIENNTSSSIFRIEWLDLSESVVAAADMNLLPGGVWNAGMGVPPGDYWVVVYGDDGAGGTCASDPRTIGLDGITTVDPGDTFFIFQYNGFLCDI
jgi:hypothetical protein